MTAAQRPCAACKNFFRDRMSAEDCPTDEAFADTITILDSTRNPRERTGIEYRCQCRRRRCRREWVVFEDLGGQLPFNCWPSRPRRGG